MLSEARPLDGRTIVVTRAATQAARFVELLEAAGARVLEAPTIAIEAPESWAPPSHVLEVRMLGRLYVALMDERRAWQQRIHAQLFHQGVPTVRGLLTSHGRVALAKADLSPAGLQMVETAVAAVESLTLQILPLRAQLQTIGCNQVCWHSPTSTASACCAARSSWPNWAIVNGSRTPTKPSALLVLT